MCSAAHGFVGLGRIVYAASSKQRIEWLEEIKAPTGNVKGLAITDVIQDIEVDGPALEFSEKIKTLYQKSVKRDT